MKNITAMPISNAAIRLTTKPTDVVNSNPQLVNIGTGANIKVIANNKNKVAVSTESRLKDNSVMAIA